jgi:hypothetical protein
MKFKAPGQEPIMVGLTSGHTIVISPKGTDVPERFRKEAIARGCIPLGVGKITADDSASADTTKAEKLIAAIDALLDSTDENAFDKDGKPNVEALSKVVGFTVSRSERDAAMEAYSKKAR